MNNKIGIIAFNLGDGVYASMAKAAELGVDGIQIYAVEGDTHPDNLVGEKRKALRTHFQSLGLEMSAVCGDMGGHGFQIREDNAVRIETTKKILALAQDLGTKIVTTHIGVIPTDDPNMYGIMSEACASLEKIAVEMDGWFAIETGSETTQTLGAFCRQFSSGRICVNYDPANLAMVLEADAAAGVNDVKDLIVHTHAKDGVCLNRIDPRYIYGYPGFDPMSHDKLSQMVSQGKAFTETPLGQGAVDFPRYLKALKDIGYAGYLTIEGETEGLSDADRRLAVEYLRGMLKTV